MIGVTEVCQAFHEEDGYFCTLDAGHSPGPHVAEAVAGVVSGVWYEGGRFQPIAGAVERLRETLGWRMEEA